MKTLSNEHLIIKVAGHGAELSSIVSKATGKEYLWQADPAFWKRHSPVLFPIVGGVWNNEYRHQGTAYTLTQHGFARDNDFTLVSESDTKIWFRLESNDATLKVYPFPFVLKIGYKLHGKNIDVMWSVKNTGKDDMYFQIGAHPAFYYPGYNPDEKERGYFAFDKKDGLEYILISEKGCVSLDTFSLDLEDGLLPVDVHTFDKDALIFQNSQLKKVALLDKNKNPYITLHFTAPVVGLWSPPAKNAPFVCIEPWYGRCDRAHYDGEFKDKDWMQHLASGKTFDAFYTIEIE
ncbi:aldose 1-epimerase family protein [Parabacteroides bouchesdurhonensis]|uniref:aldose 1-epimerase family protein n=1 Tax=Parabacteroides bouchesdurhonensis TaxID=1936995 RepID=UPI000C86256C|nr:aldose 1-epimerase family protein [Parabacteroides bouchesdurhonensis]